MRAEDEPFLLALYASTREEEFAALCGTPEQANALIQMQFRAQRISYQSAYPNAAHDLIVKDGDPVGRLYVWRGENEVRLVDIALLPAFRAHGIGAKLIGELVEECRASEKPLRLSVVRNNRARELYVRLGFRRTGGDAVYDEMMWSAEPNAAGE